MSASKKIALRTAQRGTAACGRKLVRYTQGVDHAHARTKPLAKAGAGRRSPMVRVCGQEQEEALYQRLRADIKQHGLLVPVIVGKDGAIIDGHHRARACHELGIEPRTARVQASAEDAWWSSNVIRRHLTVGERTLLALQMFKARKNLGLTQEQVAEQCGISVDSIKRAEEVIEACPEMVKDVADGKSLSGLRAVVKARAAVATVERIKQSTPSAAKAWKRMTEARVKFQVIYADPPWDYGAGDKEVTSTAQPGAHYQVMPLDAIKAMGKQVRQMASADAVCWMWVPSCLIAHGVQVMEAWGFEVATTLIWEKDHACVTRGAVRPRHEIVLIGAKPTVDVQHEFVLVGTRGKGASGLKAGAVDSVHKEARRAHSQKPDWFAEQIEALYPEANKLEMFCRSARKGWTAWGNQA